MSFAVRQDLDVKLFLRPQLCKVRDLFRTSVKPARGGVHRSLSNTLSLVVHLCMVLENS